MKVFTYCRTLYVTFAALASLTPRLARSEAAVRASDDEAPCPNRVVLSLILTAKPHSWVVQTGTMSTEVKGVLYFVDIVNRDLAETKRLWELAFPDSPPRQQRPRHFACFVAEQTGQIALAFTEGSDIRFIELDPCKALQPLEKEKDASSLTEYKLANLKSDPTRVRLPSVGGGRFARLLFRGSPKAVGIARLEGKWLVFVDVAGTVLTVARTDGEENWILLQNPVAP